MGCRNARAIGLAADGGVLCALELRRTRTLPKVTASGGVTLPPDVMANGTVADPGAAGVQLRRLLREGGFSPDAPVVAGLGSASLLLRMAALPLVPSDRLAGMVRLQAQEFLPLPLAGLALDFLPGEPFDEQGRAMQRVLLVAARREASDGLAAAVEAAGRTLLDVDASALAALRAVQLSGKAPAQPYLLCHLDRDACAALICRGDAVRMARSTPLPVGFDATRAQTAPQLLPDLQALLRYTGEPVTEALLSGGTPALAAALGGGLGLPVRQPDAPPVGGALPDGHLACLGLALRGLEG